jgi:hypothetical protein
MYHAIADVKYQIRAGPARLAEKTLPRRQPVEVGRQIDRDTSPLKEQPRAGASGQLAEVVRGKLLTVLEQ